MDSTERFPHKLLRDNEYILVDYHYDTNYIRVIPIKNRKRLMITEAYEKLYYNFKQDSIAFITYVLDNKKSKYLLESCNMRKIAFQLIPLYKHRNN